VREQAVRGAQIDDAAAAKEPADAASYFPGLVELFPRQTTGAADCTGEAMEERRAGKPIEVSRGQPPA
jgi:hypothetical protein